MVTMMEYLKTYQGPFRWLGADDIRRDKKELRTNCPNCGAPMSDKQCQYCGTTNNSYEIGDIAN